MSYNKQLCYNDLTQNQEGARAWRMTPEWELYTTVVTWGFFSICKAHALWVEYCERSA